MTTTFKRFTRHFLPVMARPSLREALRAGIGTGIALTFSGLSLAYVAARFAPDTDGLVLVAPLAATAFLMFAVPNSPLAQPWSALVGNTLSALVASLVVMLPIPPVAEAGLAVSLAILAMSMARALHPPGAAMALAAVLNEPFTLALGPSFALMPVALDTAVLIVLATIWNHATGRVYPFRQPPDESLKIGTRPASDDRLLPADALQDLLARMNLAANIGVEDLARLIAAAEEEATARRLGNLTAGDLMTASPQSIGPNASLQDIVEVFRRHAFKSLPVTGADRQFLGLITQNDLLVRAQSEGVAQPQGLRAGLTNLVSGKRRLPLARDIMQTAPLTVAPETTLAELLAVLSDSDLQALPVVSGETLIGVVTRTNLLTAFARRPLTD